MHNLRNIVITTDIPSPYQVELFNAIAVKFPALEVLYCRNNDPGRMWKYTEVNHQHTFIDSSESIRVRRIIEHTPFVIFGGYGSSSVRRLMRYRQRIRKPWCFWGESPRSGRIRSLGWLKRRLALHPLHVSTAPIWGIGSRAVEKYRKEFGERRLYKNISYFSDLSRFKGSELKNVRKPFKFLYSGSLVRRKGVDVLASAFRRLYAECPGISISFVGSGPLLNSLNETLAGLESIRFEGFKDWNELPQVYSEADCLVAPSRYDGWAMVVPEGLAAGLPVISTNQTGAAIDLIRNNINGWVTDAGSVDSLFSAMREACLKGADDMVKLSNNATESSRQCDVVAGVAAFERAIEESIAAYRF